MFASATFKLTLIYMGILTLICVFFSYNWYTIATAELERSLEQEQNAIGKIRDRPRLFNPDADDYDDFIGELRDEAEQRYMDSKAAVFSRIVASNIIIVSAGTLGSYFLARRTLEPIEKAHQEQIRFTADASHELRTPLTAMQSEIEVALRDKKFTKTEAVELLHSNIEELAKLSALSEGLLKLARQDESVGITFETVSLNAIIQKALDRVEMPAKHKKITLTNEHTDAKVTADFDSVTEMLVILLDNAVKYSPEGTSVSVIAKESKNYVTVEVTDSGIGVKESDRERIFERFYRADNSRSSQNAKGHGLGLSIAKNISDIHDARISVRSDGAGTGSTFSFRLKKA